MNTDFNSTAMLNLDHYLNGTVNSAGNPASNMRPSEEEQIKMQHLMNDMNNIREN